MSKKHLAAAMLALAAFGVMPLTARAEPPSITVIKPANGGPLAPGPGVLFEVLIPPPHLVSVAVEVASKDSVGPTGELEGSFRLERIELFESSTLTPNTYQGDSAFSSQGWSSIPGTYYWQVIAPYTDVSGGQLHAREEFSPVFTLVIAPLPSELPSGGSTTEATVVHPGGGATPSTLTLAEAFNRVKLLIRRRTGHSAHHLSDHCARTSGAEVVCQATWFSTWPRSSKTVRYAGRFVIEARSDGIHSSFVGFLERLGCVRLSGAKQCATSVHWR